MRFPDFLIIGAMKAGTTTLYRDLLTNPAVFMPADKEPWSLNTDEVLTPEGRRAYARLFRRAKADQICGEASTTYSQLPDIRGVPGRARQVLGNAAKIIFLVREPISRIVSHHFHVWTSGAIPCGIDEAVRRFPRFIDYSRYAMQITPWIDVFGRDQVLIVQFESYIKERIQAVASICHFLGIAKCLDSIRVNEAYNRSENKPIHSGLLALIPKSHLYRRLLRPMLSVSTRERLRSVLLPKVSTQPQSPSEETIHYIIDSLSEDMENLQFLMGLKHPVWDFTDVVQSHHAPQRQSP